MTPVDPALRDQVRAAAEMFVEALQEHLAAVEAKDPDIEVDEDVTRAYDMLLGAFEAYDELLYDVYDEVLPFDIDDEEFDDDEDEDDEEDDDEEDDDELEDEDDEDEQ